ncbi:MAG: DUF4469 domain-containing protein [Spirochaetales bacterium]|nr:DUF4469 domain-containing protein [Spirochaetales bacterium]
MARKNTRYTPMKECVNVTIHKSNLKGTEENPVYYGKIRQRKLNVITILEEMQKDNATVLSKEVMFYIASELSKRMMNKLSQGYALEMLDFGTLFITMKGEIKRTDKPKEISKHFGIGFTPSKQAEEAVKDFEVRAVLDVSEQHYIKKICIASVNETEPNIIQAGRIARIYGKALKLGGNVFGLFLAPIDNNEEIIPDETKWTQVENICTNRPSQIDFIVPEKINKAENYKIILRTSLAAGGKPMKRSVAIESSILTII